MNEHEQTHGAYPGARVHRPEAPARAGTVQTCPMHPQVRSDKPGTCPKCGMALEPLIEARPPNKTESQPRLGVGALAVSVLPIGSCALYRHGSIKLLLVVRGRAQR